MSLAEQLSQLRPLMTAAEVEALLGREQKEKALSALSNYEHTTGVYISFSHADGVIDYIWYSSKFGRDVAVCEVRIGMTVDAVRNALPDLRLMDGQTGEADERGVVRYQARLASENATIQLGVKDGEVGGISLYRVDMEEARARRERKHAEHAAEQDRQRQRADLWKSISDPDGMLLNWAEHCSPWGETEQRHVDFARWLIASDPDIWHLVATSWNWDYGHAPLVWIIRQERCDIATALEIFFLGSPEYYYRWVDDRSSVPSDNLEMFDFLVDIRDRLARGFYRRSLIAFDGEQRMSYFERGLKADIERGLKTGADRALAESFFPREAAMKIAGRDLSEEESEAAAECYAMLATVN